MNQKYSFTIVLITVFVILGVYEASARTNLIADNLSSFLPITFNDWQDVGDNQSATPSGVLYVFFSNTTTDGNAGGRTGMNAICSNTDPESHFCTIQELESAAYNSGVYFNIYYGDEGWIDSIYNNLQTPPINWTSVSCEGWSNIIYESGKIISNGGVINNVYYACSQIRKVACCKWTP